MLKDHLLSSRNRLELHEILHLQCSALGLPLAHDAQLLSNAFEELHNKNGLPVELEIPMESFASAV